MDFKYQVKHINDSPIDSKFDSCWFYREFVKSVSWDVFADEYRYDEKSFTKSVTKVINKIIESAGWKSQNEYFRIDCIGWISQYETIKDELQSYNLNSHLWQLKIAVEHENQKSDWTDELAKLMQIRCPLKVVIGYNYCNERENGENGKLDSAAKIITNSWTYDSIVRDKEEILLIIGNGYNKITRKSDYDSFGYRGYLFDFETGGWKRIGANA